MRKFSPLFVTTRTRSTVGLKSIPYPTVAGSGRSSGFPAASTNAMPPAAPTAVAAPVCGSSKYSVAVFAVALTPSPNNCPVRGRPSMPTSVSPAVIPVIVICAVVNALSVEKRINCEASPLSANDAPTSVRTAILRTAPKSPISCDEASAKFTA